MATMVQPPPETAAQFGDEPKGDNPQQEELDDAEFVSDDGEGNASILKPRQPARHHRARDSFYDDGGGLHGRSKNEEDNDDDDDDTTAEFRNSKWYIISAAIFVFSSILYLGMACMVMDLYWFYKDVPREVYFADDDASWWNYFVNCTDDGFMPENVTMADDDYTWYEWYNNTAFFDDDTVWTPRIANENAPGYEAQVSKYMLLYFSAAFGFLITGLIEVVLARNSRFLYRMLYYLMMLAAAFGLVSAILTNKDPLWSNITNCISTNLWALEAIAILYQRVNGGHESDEYEEYARIFGISITAWFYLADLSFMIGTVGDAVTSYFYIFELDNWRLGVSAVVFATFWLICALVYLLVAVHDHLEFKKYFRNLELEKKTMGLLDLELTPGGVVALAGDADKSTGGGTSGALLGGGGKTTTKGETSRRTDTVSLPPSSINDPPDEDEKKLDDVP